MTAEQMLRLTEGLVLTLFVGIRGYYILKTGTSGDSPTEEGPFIDAPSGAQRRRVARQNLWR